MSALVMNKASVPLSYPIGIDSEDVFWKENGKTCKGRANSGVLSKAKRTEAIKAFCEEIKRQGYDSMIYASLVWFSNQLDMSKLPYNVWCAQYYSKCEYKGKYITLWSEAHFEAMRPVMQMLADAGQKVITATILDRPWNGQTEDPYGSMVTKTLKKNGSWEYGYEIFDKWVEFMMSLGIDKQINCYSLIPWKLQFDYFDEASGQMTSINAEPSSNEYKM